MSDYYYFEDKEEECGFTPIPGEDYISALLSVSKRHGIKITDQMILKEFKQRWTHLKSSEKGKRK